MNTITVVVGEELFRFGSFTDWVNNAERRFERARYTASSVLCIDAKGRVCNTGREFMRARDDKSFPVRAFVKVV